MKLILKTLCVCLLFSFAENSNLNAQVIDSLPYVKKDRLQNGQLKTKRPGKQNGTTQSGSRVKKNRGGRVFNDTIMVNRGAGRTAGQMQTATPGATSTQSGSRVKKNRGGRVFNDTIMVNRGAGRTTGQVQTSGKTTVSGSGTTQQGRTNSNATQNRVFEPNDNNKKLQNTSSPKVQNKQRAAMRQNGQRKKQGAAQQGKRRMKTNKKTGNKQGMKRKRKNN